jgi:hypothetical protein
MEEGMEEHCRSGVHQVTIKYIQTHTHKNSTTKLPFLLSRTKMHCQELLAEDVLCCGTNVCKLAEIQEGDCGDDQKFHHSGVHVKNICSIKI